MIKRVAFIFLLALVGIESPASMSGDATAVTEKQRYFGVLLLNLGGSVQAEQLRVIQMAKDYGMNSVELTINWLDVNNKITSTPNWTKYDEQIELAVRLGMSVALRVYVARTAGNIEGYWTLDDAFHSPSGKPVLDGYSLHSFRFNHEGGASKAEDFVRKVTERYKWVHDQKKLLFISVTNTSQQEAGYPIDGTDGMTVVDYSPQTIKDFQQWLKIHYKKIQRVNYLWGTNFKSFEEVWAPGAPWDPMQSFGFRYGKDWYRFRHEVLKAFTNRMVNTVKGVDKTIKYVSEYGSVFANFSNLCGTVAFGDLNKNTDGVKNHDAIEQDHRFSMDVMRGAMPEGAFLGNEVFPVGASHADYLKQIDENFEHGADLVVFVLPSVPLMQNHAGVLRLSADKWVNGSQPVVVARDTVSYNIIPSVEKGVEAIVKDRWRQVAYKDPKNPKAVHLVPIDDLMTDAYWNDIVNLSPLVQNPLPMKIFAIGKDFSFSIPMTTFSDPDGEIVRLEVRDLPSWITFQNGTLTGRANALGDTRIRVIGVDDEGGTADAYFTIRIETVESLNRPPVVKNNINSLIVKVNDKFQYEIIPDDLFSDVDGRIAKVEVRDLPGWLSYQNNKFDGLPTQVGNYRVTLVAYDNNAAFVELYFTLKVVEHYHFNNPPFVLNALPPRYVKVKQPFKYAIPSNIFGDTDGYISTISAYNMPTWLNFTFNEFSGTPPEKGIFPVKVRAYDNSGSYVETVFSIHVETPNLNFSLMKSGETNPLAALPDGAVVHLKDLPALINISASSNFDFDRIQYLLTGPVSYDRRTRTAPYSLFSGKQGFVPVVGTYTIRANSYYKDSLYASVTSRFSITNGDSLQLHGDLQEYSGYPNPFQDVFIVNLPSASSLPIYGFTLITLDGRRTPIPPRNISIGKGVAQIDLTDMSVPSGIYIIHLEEDKKVKRRFKVVKK